MSTTVGISPCKSTPKLLKSVHVNPPPKLLESVHVNLPLNNNEDLFTYNIERLEIVRAT